MQLMADAAYPARILETRKTAPGLRLVDKWAVRFLHFFISYICCIFYLISSFEILRLLLSYKA